MHDGMGTMVWGMGLFWLLVLLVLVLAAAALDQVFGLVIAP